MLKPVLTHNRFYWILNDVIDGCFPIRIFGIKDYLSFRLVPFDEGFNPMFWKTNVQSKGNEKGHSGALEIRQIPDVFRFEVAAHDV